jgi:hypothetical protein
MQKIVKVIVANNFYCGAAPAPAPAPTPTLLQSTFFKQTKLKISGSTIFSSDYFMIELCIGKVSNYYSLMPERSKPELLKPDRRRNRTGVTAPAPPKLCGPGSASLVGKVLSIIYFNLRKAVNLK